MKDFRRIRIVAILLVAALVFVQNAASYGVITHAAISLNAWKSAFSATIQKNFFQALQIDPQQVFGPVLASPPAGVGPFTASGWIVAGSQYEDDQPLPVLNLSAPSARPLFHFLDPYFNRGLSVLPFISLTSTSSDWGVFGSGSSLFCLPPPACTPIAANNDFPYSSGDPTRDARAHFFNGLTQSDPSARSMELGKMFRSLGQVIHLLQDTAQPQHVRNDFHLDLAATPYAFLPDILQRPSAYERYVDAKTGLQNLPGTPTSIRFDLPQLFFANGSGSGLAQFTNTNFVSAGTNCTNTITCNAVGNYPAPSMSGGSTNMLYNGGVLTFFTNHIYDKYTGATTQNPRMTTYSLFDSDLILTNNAPIFSLNHFNYDQQAQILIPQAVDYSAGLLEYFFRGSLSAQSASGGTTIMNTSAEDMTGTFTLYYDDKGTPSMRHAVSGASWQSTIAAGGVSTPQMFTPPTNPMPQTAGQYILVFHGTLGAESGAVAGAVVNLNPTLTITKSGAGNGTVTSVPAGINCGPSCGTESATFSGSVQLTASPATGSAFTGWSGDCAGTSSSTSITMTSDKHCIATFTQAGLTISVTLAGSGTGNVQSFPSGINCGGGGTVCTASFPFGPGASVSLYTTPATGSFLESWTGCSSVDLGFCDVLVQSNTQNAQITATFLQYALAITSVSYNVAPGANLSNVHMVITAQATGGVGSWVTDDDGNQTSQSCGAWSGPTGLFGISCTRGSGQPIQSTFQFTEDHGVIGPFPFPNPVTFPTQVVLSTAVPINFQSPSTLVVNGPSITIP